MFKCRLPKNLYLFCTQCFWCHIRTLGLQKAFDTIDHDILLKQISVIGFSNQAFDWFQSLGFRKNHSTSSCLTCLHEKCFKDFDTRLMTGVILVDLQKTFNTIDHDISLK